MNGKGFILIETLIVSVFIMGTFTFIYMNLLPTIANYDNKINYYSVDGLYKANLIRKLIINDRKYNTIISYTNFKDLTPSNFSIATTINSYYTELNIDKIIITSYNLTNVKNLIKNNYNDKDLSNYLDFLPNYNNDTSKESYSRLIIKYKDYTFSTVEIETLEVEGE